MGDNRKIVQPCVDVGPCVISQPVSTADDFANEVRVFLGLGSEDEEGGPTIVPGQFVQNERCLIRGRAIVERQREMAAHHFRIWSWV